MRQIYHLHRLEGSVPTDPALTLAIPVLRGDVAGDPSGWARALADIDSVRNATRSRGAHIVLAVVSEAPLGDVPEDRAQSLIRQAGIERR